MPEVLPRTSVRRTPNARSNLERTLNAEGDDAAHVRAAARTTGLACVPRGTRIPRDEEGTMGTTTVVVLAHAASTLVLVGIIWTVQWVHYPLMALVGRERFVAYEQAHAPRMAAVVLLPWTVQGVTTAWLLVAPPPGTPGWLILAAAVAAAVPVLVTVVASVPAHRRLGDGFDPQVHRRLVATNWLRTAAWTVHGGIAVAIAVTAG